jgi:hypothetical protein
MRKHIGPSRLYRAVAAVGALFAPMLLQSSARAAAPATNPSLSDHELVQQLLERVNKDDAQINELREKLAAKSAPSTDAIDAVTKRIEADEAAIQEVKSSVADAVNKEPDEQTFPAIQFHGFADLT